MKAICLHFQVHQPFRFRTYRFFEMGEDHYYFDDYQNRHLVQQLAQSCYMPANNMIMNLIKKHGKKFCISFSISGVALNLFEQYAPEIIQSFQNLVKTGNIEIVSEPYSHSLSGLKDKNEFIRQIKTHTEKIKLLFGVKPKTFSNTELIYSNDLGVDVSDLGYSAMLTEGAKHILAWRSANFLYSNIYNPNLKLFLRNVSMSEDLILRFGNRNWEHWPLTAEKLTDWIAQMPEDQQIINLSLPYETLGFYQSAETGIFDFFNTLPQYILQKTDFQFKTPQQIIKTTTPTSPLDVPYPISWFDEERDVTIWMGNEMQSEALSKLYAISEKINKSTDQSLKEDWIKLQSADNFFYMSTKWFSGSSNVRMQENYYASPYEAFINYMNILSDIYIRLENAK